MAEKKKPDPYAIYRIPLTLSGRFAELLLPIPFVERDLIQIVDWALYTRRELFLTGESTPDPTEPSNVG